MKRITDRRAAERREYAKRKAAYLLAHPLDQIVIALHGFDEEALLASIAGLDYRFKGVLWKGCVVHYSDQIHHRNRCYGARLNDERWWMATTMESHRFVEDHASWSRENGFLLPVQADSEGRWGNGNQALPTTEFMKARSTTSTTSGLKHSLSNVHHQE